MENFINLWLSTGLSNVLWGQLVMMAVGFLLIYLDRCCSADSDCMVACIRFGRIK